MTTPAAPKRIQRKRTAGWRKPEGTVIVDRTSRFGNPFTAAACIEYGFADTPAEARQRCVEAFEDVMAHGRDSEWWFEGAADARARILADLPLLSGRDLACACPEDGLPCHADVLLRLANPPTLTEQENPTDA